MRERLCLRKKNNNFNKMNFKANIKYEVTYSIVYSFMVN